MPKKPITNKVINKQEIISVNCDVPSGVVSVEVEFSRETVTAGKTSIDNKSTTRFTIPLVDLQPHFNNFINHVETLV